MKSKIVSAARQALAEACWKGYRAKGMKKKGNRMVPNCVKEAEGITALLKTDDSDSMSDIKKRTAAIKKAAADAKKLGKDPVEAADAMQKRLAAQADKEHYGESEDPRMKTTPASIAQGGGDPKVYKQEKAKKDPQPASKKKKKASRRATLGRKDAAPSANHPDYLKKKLYKRGVKPKGYGKEGESKEGLSTAQVNRMGKRGQEGKISKKKKAINMEMSKQILAARKRRAAKGKDKKLSSAQLATIARRAKDKSD